MIDLGTPMKRTTPEAPSNSLILGGYMLEASDDTIEEFSIKEAIRASLDS